MQKQFFVPATMALCLMVLAACGTSKTDRGLSGAGIGGAAGYAVGAPVAGALVGGAAGVFTDPGDVNLGEPLWK